MGELGRWITDGSARPFYARREFTVDGQVAGATARVCGLGQFVFWVNGRKVGDHELDPGWTDYRKWAEYVIFEVGDLLHPGRNALGAEVGNGWYLKDDHHYTFRFPPFMPPNPNPYRPFGSSLVLALELEIRYRDGRRQVITADESFRVERHPVVHSNVYGSETVDGRLRRRGWAEAGFDDRTWAPARVVPEEEAPQGVLAPQLHPPIKVIRAYPGRFLHRVGQRDIYDLGQNMSGILRLEARGKAGDVIRLYPAEKLGPDGDVDQMAKGWGEVDSVFTCVIGEDDVWESFRMKFTYFAGRMVGVERSSQKVQLRELAGEAITSAWRANGTFLCSDARYNQIYSLVERSVEANMVSVHTDCPTIERFAWQEPNHLMGAAIMYMKDGRDLWRKFFRDMREGQHREGDCFLDQEGNPFFPGEGLVPAQCPCYIPNVLPVPGLGDFYDIPPWGSSCILGVRWHYLFYGDLQVVEENYDMGMRYLAHLKGRVNGEGFLNHGLGDWGNPEGELARENVETAFLYADTMTMAWFARLLGRENDREELLAYAAAVRKRYNEALLVQDGQGRWCYRSWEHQDELVITQACQAIPLYWGLVPEDKTADVAAALGRLLEERGALVSGEVGLPYIIQAAAEHGMNDLIAACITREEHPSYYAFVKEGLTTLGEYWENNPRSQCHDMLGHIAEWYYNGMAGIRPEEPGFRAVAIRPYLPPDMEWLSCDYESASGPIGVRLRRETGEIRLEVSVPRDMPCRIDTRELERQGAVTVVRRPV